MVMESSSRANLPEIDIPPRPTTLPLYSEFNGPGRGDEGEGGGRGLWRLDEKTPQVLTNIGCFLNERGKFKQR